MRRDVERAAVVAEAAVGRLAAGEDRAQVGAVGREHEHAAGAGGEEVARGIDLQPVRQPRAGDRKSVV